MMNAPRFSYAIFLILAVTVLHGCASMSEAECQAADWRLRGADDARAGHPRSYVNDHTKACAEYGIRPDLANYQAGWNTGIEDYCTRENGWQVGRSGGSHESICPAKSQAAFNDAYQLGSALYRQQTSVSTLELELSGINTELDELIGDEDKKKELKKKRKRIKKDLSAAQATLLLTKIDASQRGFPVDF